MIISFSLLNAARAPGRFVGSVVSSVVVGSVVMSGRVIFDDDLLDNDGLDHLGQLLGPVLVNIRERGKRGKRRQLKGRRVVDDWNRFNNFYFYFFHVMNWTLNSLDSVKLNGPGNLDGLHGVDGHSLDNFTNNGLFDDDLTVFLFLSPSENTATFVGWCLFGELN